MLLPIATHFFNNYLFWRTIMTQLNTTALASLTTLAIRADLQNTTIPNTQGQHFPLAASGVVIGKSYAAELVKHELNLEEQALLTIVTTFFEQIDLSQIDLTSPVLSIKAGKQSIIVDLSEYTTKVSTALRVAKLASIKERIGCDILDLLEHDATVTIIGYSLVALKEEYEVLRKPISDLALRLDTLEQETFAAFKKRDFTTISKLDSLKVQLSSEFVFELTLSLV